jgi:hypothetical protein
MPIRMLRGILMTKNYVGETSEVAGWGIYDIGAKGAPAQGDTQITLALIKCVHVTNYFSVC